MKHWLSMPVVGVAFCLLALGPISAQEKSVRPGINKPFENPDVKDFLKKFEGESREIAAHAKEIVAACKLKPGMAVADVGAGTGLFTRKFAAEVGDKGKVFAVDIAETFLRHIEKTCADGKIKNVQTIQCDQFSTKLPKNAVDLVFICDTYHHFEFPQRTLQSIHEALRPGGQMILIDFHRIEGKSREWVLGHVRAGQDVFVREIKAAGFSVVGEERILKENYFVRFAPAWYRKSGAAPRKDTSREMQLPRSELPLIPANETWRRRGPVPVYDNEQCRAILSLSCLEHFPHGVAKGVIDLSQPMLPCHHLPHANQQFESNEAVFIVMDRHTLDFRQGLSGVRLQHLQSKLEFLRRPTRLRCALAYVREQFSDIGSVAGCAVEQHLGSKLLVELEEPVDNVGLDNLGGVARDVAVEKRHRGEGALAGTNVQEKSAVTLEAKRSDHHGAQLLGQVVIGPLERQLFCFVVE